MISTQIINAVGTCFSVFYLLLLIRCLLTFIPTLDWSNPPLRWLREGVDFYLDFFRKFIPPVGPFDFSPILAFLALGVIQWAVVVVLRIIFSIIGL